VREAVETLQHPWEIDQLEKLARSEKVRRVLEIGAWEGGTLWRWLQLAETVVVIDDEMRLEDRWRGWSETFGCDLFLLKGRSQNVQIQKEAAALVAQYDLIFIDADHDYEAVKADLEAYLWLLRNDGMLALHDIRPYEHGQVDLLWRELKALSGRTVEIIDRTVQDRWGGIGVYWK
jgi:predicted O-methyltransferase YrrM